MVPRRTQQNTIMQHCSIFGCKNNFFFYFSIESFSFFFVFFLLIVVYSSLCSTLYVFGHFILRCFVYLFFFLLWNLVVRLCFPIYYSICSIRLTFREAKKPWLSWQSHLCLCDCVCALVCLGVLGVQECIHMCIFACLDNCCVLFHQSSNALSRFEQWINRKKATNQLRAYRHRRQTLNVVWLK